MWPRQQPSLTLRSTLAFSMVAMLTVGGAGLYLYESIKASVMMNSDHAVLARLDHFRKLLHFELGIEKLRDNPQILKNMLYSENDIFIIGETDQPPVIMVNPLNVSLPDLPVINHGTALSVDALRSGVTDSGAPLRAATVQTTSGGREVRLTAAHVMTREMAMLKAFRERIYLAVSLAFLLTALLGYILLRRGLRPLRTMATHAANITPQRLDSRMDSKDTPIELQQLSDAYNAMLDRLANGYQRLTQFSADLAHEIRTPVGSLMGHCQVALRQSRSEDEYQALLASNLEELERISRIVESILFLARADDAQSVIEREPLSLNSELQRIAGYFEGLAEERQLTLQTTGDGILEADPLLLRRALSNLVANAIRYANEGSEILMRVVAVDGGWQIDVENQGPVLSDETLRKLFDRFYRGDTSRHQSSDSYGLGLTIVAAIMQLHGGEASVKQPEPGTIRFSLFFPAP
ncbi:heavy metal sensor histidine kinase [Pseudomonas sp. M30-35]|uniref:heavy metal sensor histidine kinase n=1 Tax=Pseudomonas sp. M30-35 TaxID=1981174 RepID=UPI000B3C5F16|nr:heavy metal sensor histidine kinase [Pseudomonas sp. M30-35]ARU88895.1 two-component sensor histidine kinase [Pseudomonas sp. M30-35]